MRYLLNSTTRIMQNKRTSNLLIQTKGRTHEIRSPDAEALAAVRQLAENRQIEIQLDSSEVVSHKTVIMQNFLHYNIVSEKRPADQMQFGDLDPKTQLGQIHAVAVVGDGLAIDIVNRLRRHSVEIREPSDADILIAGSIPYDHPMLHQWNRYALDANKPILFFTYSHGAFEIGPLTVPQQTACFECVEQRMRAALQNDAYCRTNWIELTQPALPSFVLDLGASLIASVICRVVSGERINVLLNEQIILDVDHLEMHTSPIRRVSSCPACGHVDPTREKIR